MTKAQTVEVRKKRRLFHGWLIVLSAFLSDFMSDGVGMWTFGLFFKPMSVELGWTRAMTSGAFTIRSVLSAFTGPLIGPLVDKKHGPRLLMAMGGLVGGVAIMSLSRISALWQFYLVYSVLGAMGLIGFGGLVTNTVVSKWFVRKRGRAIAITTMGYSLSGVVLTPIVQYLISRFGWRTTWIFLGSMIWLLVVLPSALFMRRRPEDVGLMPDGDEAELSTKLDNGTVVSSSDEQIWTAKEALRTSTLWLLLAALSTGGTAIGGIMVHLVPYLTDRGFSGSLAAVAMTTFAICMASSKLPWGFLAERVHVRYCIMAGYVGSATGLAILLNARSVPLVFLFVVVYGLAQGGAVVLSNLAWANYFGRTFLGTIRGVVGPFNLLSSAGGPLFAGYIFDVTESYRLAFAIYIATYLLAALLMVAAKPRRLNSMPVSISK